MEVQKPSTASSIAQNKVSAHRIGEGVLMKYFGFHCHLISVGFMVFLFKIQPSTKVCVDVNINPMEKFPFMCVSIMGTNSKT